MKDVWGKIMSEQDIMIQTQHEALVEHEHTYTAQLLDMATQRADIIV
jgi:hypothetical protein